ncbi:hypothetical protein A3K34_03750 [candidate division WWE3 bacterium RIFOXYC1_FULL_40_10]|uniref:Uncharacterized protein n=1 Tax=candidate division WWE3 bacterium RIFOXYA2_FULL_46_9 TaxID=1802636 RepID=A0A1F4W319_UNCKA|nr:MAG: hypothetical protein A3K58_03750 [candidate division WWE3 bacterium RIFOXYB1_FULL_40_22]OGC61955.1 MAG: hypothetical protein A3K37_03750 [candidate division WWE3 bacterium RIFOXYA1_FULL_40_11]OGC63781.1 MAG: hypothetical protein A2264_02700 [candidate division WWE3 bacterium RIFOXYA2_FULL_46_9]OGC64512.1 MAG: hypothetical protein A2326_03890 [candidate division WWE3 bacterium RIFOXYB2_FULL_41_6]OGC66338.1 MAG: hypothetical protein A3K34_03750 [candidate division WWE3 bacterium RIFOXYC1_
MKVITRIDPKSFANFYAIGMGLFMAIMLPFQIIGLIFGGKPEALVGTVVVTVIALLLGWIIGYVCALVTNLALKLSKGISIEMKDQNSNPLPQN